MPAVLLNDVLLEWVNVCMYVHTCVIQNYELMVKLNDIIVLIL